MEKGTYVVVRCSGAGVHAGVLVSQSGTEVKLSESRRLWQWRVPMGASQFLSGVATSGLDYEHSKVGVACDALLLDACEVIACTPEATASLRGAPVAERVR